MRMRSVRRTGWSVGVAVALILGCQDGRELEPRQRMAYEVKPAVVRVNAYATGELLVSAELTEAATRTRGVPHLEPKSDLIVSTGTGNSGSGFIVHPDGWIVTSAHVVGEPLSDEKVAASLRRNGAVAALASLIPSDEMEALRRSGELDRLASRIGDAAELSGVEIRRSVDLSNGESFEFGIKAVSPRFEDGGSDLALLQIDRRELPTLRLAPVRDAYLQESVWIAGYPAVASTSDSSIGDWLSLDTDLEATFSSGSITAQRKSRNGTPLLQTDAEIHPGNSGGPAVDENGEVIGVPTWGHADAEDIRFLVAGAPIRALLAGAGVPVNQESELDRVWDDALERASDGDWKGAEKRLERADLLFPGSPDLARLRADAALATQMAPSPGPRIAIVSILILGAGLFAAERIYRKSRRKGRAVPVSFVEEVRLLPSMGPTVQESESGTNGLGSFTILNGERAGVRFSLGGPGIRIGRDARLCELVLENPKVSRLHAEVVKLDGRTMLIDRNSSNGTWVNDERVEKVLLTDGDIIYFGGRHAVAAAFRREESCA